MQISANQGGDYWGRLHVITQPTLTTEQREQLIRDVRAEISLIPDLNSTVDFPSLISIDMPLTLEIQGHDLARVQTVAYQLVTELNTHNNFQDVRAGVAEGQPELTIRFDHARLAFAGLTAPQVAQVITQKMGGQVASKYSLDDRQIDIRVRLPDAYRQNPQEVAQLIVNPGAERELTLSSGRDCEPGNGSR